MYGLADANLLKRAIRHSAAWKPLSLLSYIVRHPRYRVVLPSG